MLKNLISREEKLIIDIIFSKKKLQKSSFIDIDYGKVVKIASNHLILPTLFKKLKINSYIKHTPKDFSNYLEEIFSINNNRNNKLINEISIINKLFNKHKLLHVFLKGSAHIICDLYEAENDRMIGDIDILTKETEGEKAIEILRKNGYLPVTDKKFFQDDKKHYVRHYNPKKIFAVEIHTPKLLKKNIVNFNGKRILKNKIQIKSYFIPSFSDQLLHNIYNFQINDYGYLYLKYGLRTLYDTKLIVKKIKNIEEYDKYINQYFGIGKLLGIYFPKSENYKLNPLKLLILILINKNFTLRKLFSMCVKIYFRTKFVPLQIKELAKNKAYRKYIFEKIFKSKL